MVQIYTVLLDSLRLLRSQKLFWIVVWISALVGVAYSSVGFDQRGISVGFGLYHFENSLITDDTELARLFYLLVFTNLINDWWLGFFALVLALISSCSVFPELIREGSIDLMVSRPLSRLKLFMTKFLGVLLFMALPVLLLCVICFFALGVRVDVWKPEIFLAVPLLMLVFSLIFSVAVFVGVLWRSTLFALLASVLLWTLTFVLHLGEVMVYNFVYTMPAMGVEMDLSSGQVDESAEIDADPLPAGENIYVMVKSVGAPFPKIRKCTLMLKRLVAFDDELGAYAGLNLISLASGQMPMERQQSAAAQFENRMSVSYLVWSSLLFEFVVLGGAAWIFCRRDF